VVDRRPSSTFDSISASGVNTKPEMNHADVDLIDAVGGLALDAANNEVRKLDRTYINLQQH